MDVGPVARRLAARAEAASGPAWTGDRGAYTGDIVESLQRHPSSQASIEQADDVRVIRLDDALPSDMDALEARLRMLALRAPARTYEIAVPATHEAWRGQRMLHFAGTNGALFNPARVSVDVAVQAILDLDASSGPMMAAVANMGTDRAVVAPEVGQIFGTLDPNLWFGSGPLAATVLSHELRHLSSGLARTGLAPDRFVGWFQEGGAQLAMQADLVGRESDLKLIDWRATTFADAASQMYPVEQQRIRELSSAAGYPLELRHYLDAFGERFQELDDVEHLEHLVARVADRYRITADRAIDQFRVVQP